MAVTKQKLRKWLLRNCFEELKGKATSHRQYKHASGVIVTVPMHGRPELSKKHLGMILRQLETAGFSKEQVRTELGEEPP